MLRTLAFLALWLFVFVTALSGGWSVMFHISYLLLLLYGVAWGWTRLSVRWPRIERQPASPRSQVGEELVEQVTVSNASWLPVPWLAIRATATLPGHELHGFASLGPHGEQSWTSRTLCDRRGEYELGPTTVTVGDPFGFFQRERVFPPTRSVLVYPATVELPRLGLLDGELPGGGQRRERVPHITAMATSIRDYQPGDPFNRIHWRHSARLGQLVVKEFEEDPVADVWVVLDLDRNVHLGQGLESTEEYAVTIAASLMRHFLLQTRAVGLLCQGQVLQPDRGTRQLIRALELLAVVRAQQWLGLGDLLTANAVRVGRGSSLIVITPTVWPQWLSALQQISRRGVRSAVVLLEASTFGSAQPSLALVGELSAANVPMLLIKQGEPLAPALAASGSLAVSQGVA